MLISHAWLRDWVPDAPAASRLAEVLTRGGLEVAAVRAAAPALSKKHVVVGAITRCERLPGSAKLQVCDVAVGGGESLTLVCGAANARLGVTVAVAMVGAKLPGDVTITAREIGGVMSAGMICSAAELGLEEASDGILILDDDAVVGRALADHLRLAKIRCWNWN